MQSFISVPFKTETGMSTVNGVAKFSPAGIVLEFESKFLGLISTGVTYIAKNTIIAVGTNGSDVTSDGGKTWKKFGDENLNTVQAKGRRAVWAVGPKGVVLKMK